MSSTFQSLLVSQSWQIAACAVVAFVIAAAVGRHRPHLAHLVWLLVLIKALTPPVFASQTSPFSWLQMERPATVTESQPPAPLSTTTDVIPSVFTPASPTIPASIAESPVVERPDPATADPAATTVGWSAVLLAIWAVGTLAILTTICVSTWRSWRRLAASRVEVNADLVTRFADLAGRLGLTRTPRLLATTQPLGPAAGGILHGTVILPAELLDFSAAELEPLLAHELVHLRRRDPLTAVLQWVAVSFWWWHPAIWWASRHVSRERERCCDAEVLGTLSYPPQQYAQRLIDTLRLPSASPARPAPLTIPLTPPAHQRLEYIMHRGPFSARPPRQNLLVAALLAMLLIPGAALPTRSPAAAQATPDDQPATDQGANSSEDQTAESDETGIDPPELVYLGWQISDQIVGQPMWRPNGELVNEAEIAEALKKTGQRSFAIHRRANDELHPLVLVFKADQRLKNTSVYPRVILPDGTLTALATWRNSMEKPLVVSAAAPKLSETAQWPDEVSLQIRYPVEDRQVIKTITEIPDDPVELADGVTWFLDPAWAVERDQKTGETRRPPGMTAALLQSRRDPLRLNDFDVRIYLKDRPNSDEAVRSYASTIREVDDVRYDLEISEPIAGKGAIEGVEFTRIRHAQAVIDNVKLRPDVLAQLTGKADAPDPEDIAAVQSFDRDYGLQPGQVLKHVVPPFPDSRMAYYRIQHARQAESIPDGPTAMIFHALGFSPELRHFHFANPEPGVTLRQLLPELCQIGDDRLRGEERLLDQQLPGDFVIRRGASRDQIVAALNPILRTVEPQPVYAALQNTEQDVVCRPW